MGWKIYFFIFTVLILIAYALIFTGSPAIWDYIDTVESTFVLLGLFAYAYKKKIGSPVIWKYLLFVFITWDISYNFILSSYLEVAQQSTVDDSFDPYIGAIVGWVIVIPAYFAIYRLGFKSEQTFGLNT